MRGIRNCLVDIVIYPFTAPPVQEIGRTMTPLQIGNQPSVQLSSRTSRQAPEPHNQHHHPSVQTIVLFFSLDMTGPLDREAILQGMADAIPTHPPGDSSSDVSSSYEALALLIHTYMTALKFRLLGFDEDKRNGAYAPYHTALTTAIYEAPFYNFLILTNPHLPEDECASLAPRLPPSWNASFGSHSFVYAHKQSAMTFVVKVDRLGSKIEVRGLAVGDERIFRFERNVRDVVRSAGLPIRITLTEDGREDRGDLKEKLKKVFVSEEAVDGEFSLLSSLSVLLWV